MSYSMRSVPPELVQDLNELLVTADLGEDDVRLAEGGEYIELHTECLTLKQLNDVAWFFGIDPDDASNFYVGESETRDDMTEITIFGPSQDVLSEYMDLDSEECEGDTCPCHTDDDFDDDGQDDFMDEIERERPAVAAEAAVNAVAQVLQDFVKALNDMQAKK